MGFYLRKWCGPSSRRLLNSSTTGWTATGRRLKSTFAGRCAIGSETAGGHHFGNLRAAARRTLRHRIVAGQLQVLKMAVAMFTVIFENRHALKPPSKN
jgi:hypothetical protein